MSEQNTPPRRRKWLFLSVIILTSAIAGGVITVMAQCYIIKHHSHKFIHGPIDQKTAEKRAEWIANRVAKKVNATPEQKAKLITVSKSLATDLLPFREKLKATRGQIRDLLTQDKIDSAKIEEFRAEKLALMDTISKRVTSAITEVAEVLTQEQRKKISKRFLRKRHYER